VNGDAEGSHFATRHAGYSYSGPAAAWAYRSIDCTGIKRVFILGPSHHKSIDGCDLSPCGSYETPLGPLPLDVDTITDIDNAIDREKLKKYKKPGQTNYMKVATDEAEHSIEMHLPYVRKVFEGVDIKIVPILVGAMNKDQEMQYGNLLAPYLSREDTFCVVSSDFCHWGSRFDFMHYYPEPPLTDAPSIDLQFSKPPPSSFSTFPIHASISADKFAAYLRRTANTICGRHPIGVLLGALTALEKEGHTSMIKWVRYEQSSQCFNTEDSSVSYASAYVSF